MQTQRDLAASAILPSQPPLRGCDVCLVDLIAQVTPSSEGSGHVALLRHKSYLGMSSSVPHTPSPPLSLTTGNLTWPEDPATVLCPLQFRDPQGQRETCTYIRSWAH